ncbi:uncharacterized protein HRG_08496 [Hirsutella rhossiliensis]|uniref:Uncharacterized protein n=1 Tax=Hirsutella rhossiliensis TaxID=111463 RepID=A0A9P8MU97_9HYPO|nr:uncharacterized protein HRG_08496 [Hirsutella rhossiliensis]KAH0960341.1 hypothetical protein HRG_08496 [Hirsutella rhossiliensis]
MPTIFTANILKIKTRISATALDKDQQEVVNNEIHETMSRAIFGSNMIERAGLGWDITVQLCRKVFAGEDIGQISERDATYQESLLKLYKQQFDLKDMREMCESLKQELTAAEERRTIDPFSIAAKYSLMFVEIRPF